MAIHRVQAPVMRRFLITLVVVTTVTGLVCRELGEDITVWLGDNLEATDRGWPVIGWLFGGPPLLLAALAWNDRKEHSASSLRSRATWYAVWFGIGGFALPALVDDSAELFGRGVEVGNPLAFGWTCGASANLAAIAFAYAITRMSAQGDTAARRLALRFIETAWILLVGGSLLFAAYGRELGFNY